MKRKLIAWTIVVAVIGGGLTFAASAANADQASYCVTLGKIITTTHSQRLAVTAEQPGLSGKVLLYSQNLVTSLRDAENTASASQALYCP